MATRGGRRVGAGGKPAWKHGATKPVRVPIALAERILKIARILDEGKFVDLDYLEEVDELVTESKIIDLAGVAILYSKNGPVVRLADLVRVGYQLSPERLGRGLEAQSTEPSDLDKLLFLAEQKNE